MPDVTVRHLSEMDSGFGGAFKRARAALGVSSFGLSVLELPAGFDSYPEHSHAKDGQEEVYVALSGRGTIEVDGERLAIDPQTFVRVGPSAKRRVMTDTEPIRLLIVGGVPGAAYNAPLFSELGAPDDAPRSGRRPRD